MHIIAFFFHVRKPYLTHLYCHDCDHKFTVWRNDCNFKFLDREKFTALIIINTRLWQLSSAVIATLATWLVTVYLFTDAECVPHPLMGLFTVCTIKFPSIFSTGCIKTPRYDAPKFGNIFQCIYHKCNICYWFVDMLSCFKVCASNWWRSSKILGFPLPNFLGAGRKILESRFSSLTPHQTCVQISWQFVKGWLSPIV